MKPFLIAICTYAIFVLHSALARDLAISGITPHIILAGLIVMSARVGAPQGVLLAAGWGLLADCLAEGRLGPAMICYVFVAISLHRGTRRWKTSAPWKYAALSIPLIWGSLIACEFLRGFPTGRFPDLAAVAFHAAGCAVYTGLLAAAADRAIRFAMPGLKAELPPSAPAVSNKWRMLTE